MTDGCKAARRSCVKEAAASAIRASTSSKHSGMPLSVHTKPVICTSVCITENSPRKRYLKSVSQADPAGPIPSSVPIPNQPVTSFTSAKASPLFTTEYFEVLKTANKGYAAFATKDIPEGTTILTEEPLLKATEASFIFEYEKLSTEERRIFKTLCCFSDLDMHESLARFKTNR